jgi:Fic/DOC family
MALFDDLGFHWDRDSVPREIPRASIERVAFRFHRMLPEYVWDAGVLEGNPFTFPEVKTLLEGVTVGGRKISDQEQILNLGESSKYLLDMVKRRAFKLEKSTFCSLHKQVARNEALEWGHFRGEGPETQFTPDVALGARGRYTPLATEPGAVRLNEVFASGIQALERDVPNPFERATAFFLFGSLQQFFFDGNKRTSRFMMNGMLMTDGIDAISIPAVRAAEFNSRMVDFYQTRDATVMMAFVLDCHPEIAQIRQLNPGLSVVNDLPGIEYSRLEESMRRNTHDEPSAGGGDRGAGLDRESTYERQTLPLSLEEIQQDARENWRRNYYDRRVKTSRPQPDTPDARTPEDNAKEHESDAGFDSDLEP